KWSSRALHQLGPQAPRWCIRASSRALTIHTTHWREKLFSIGIVPAVGIGRCIVRIHQREFAMPKKTLVASLLAAALTAPAVPAAEPEHTLSGNVGLFSQYVFRGLRQTD